MPTTKLCKTDLLKKLQRRFPSMMETDLFYNRTSKYTRIGWYIRINSNNNHVFLGKNIEDANDRADVLVQDSLSHYAMKDCREFLFPLYDSATVHDALDFVESYYPFLPPQIIHEVAWKAYTCDTNPNILFHEFLEECDVDQIAIAEWTTHRYFVCADQPTQRPQPVQQPQAQAMPVAWPDLAKIATPDFQKPAPKPTATVVNITDYMRHLSIPSTPTMEKIEQESMGQLIELECRHLPPQKIGADIGGDIVTTQNRDWLDPISFAELTNISERSAQRILSGAFNLNKPWRGSHLHVRIIQREKGGGNGGESYEVNALSLPEELQSQWYARFIPTSPLAIPSGMEIQGDTTAFRTGIQKAVDGAMEKYEIIKEIIPLPIKTKLRKTKVLEIAHRENVNPSTIYDWLNAYCAGDGLAGITRKPRNDHGKKRTLLTREWDHATTHIEERARSTIVDQTEEYIRSLWAAGYGWTDITLAGSLKLQELTQSVDPAIPTDTLKNICQLTRARVEREKGHKIVHLKNTDAKAFYDTASPTIRRHRHGLLPNDIWVGDVHHIDILLTRPDGTIATPKMIAWYDPATNHAYITAALMEAGRMIRRQDVALSFASAVAYRGLPKKLFIDNGVEFDWRCMLDGFATLNRMVPHFAYALGEPELEPANPIESFMGEDTETIHHTKPYQPRARPIEGWFGLFEQKYLSKIPGYIGGNRMKKPTQNLGKAPKPYPGSWEEFFKDLEIKLGEYHSRPQRGHLHNHSPNQALAQFIDCGWQSTQCTDTSVLLAFAERSADRKVWPGGRVVWNNLNYRHDALIPYVSLHGIQGSIELRVSTHDPRYVFVVLPTKEILTVPLDREYPFFDLQKTGAKEQERMKRLLDHYVAEKAHNCSRIDHRQLSLELTKAAGPAPAIPFGTHIELTSELVQMEQLTTEAEVVYEATNNQPITFHQPRGRFDKYED